MSTFYYFRLLPKSDQGLLQIDSGFYQTRSEAEAGLDIVGMHLKSPMSYVLLEVRVSPESDVVVATGEIPRI